MRIQVSNSEVGELNKTMQVIKKPAGTLTIFIN